MNVGIVLSNPARRVFWGRCVGHDRWQFPQGGIREDEAPIEAMFRELYEEVGLVASQVSVVATTPHWLKYDLPPHLIRFDRQPVCYGQKQKWFLLAFRGRDEDFCLNGSQKPEFDRWRWVDYWFPLRQVVAFKREVYRQALSLFAPCLGIADLPDQ